jgi:hypothetical protein
MTVKVEAVVEIINWGRLLMTCLLSLAKSSKKLRRWIPQQFGSNARGLLARAAAGSIYWALVDKPELNAYDPPHYM